MSSFSRRIARAAGTAALCLGGTVAACGHGPYAPATGHVVMPHPDACGCREEKQTFSEKLWERWRPGHRDRYLTHQHKRHLNNPECPPWCMENFGHYRTCWRPFPEHTLGCRECSTTPAPIRVVLPPPVPAAPLPDLAPPFSPPQPLPAAPPQPPADYDSFSAPTFEESFQESSVQPAFRETAFIDPAWRAGLRPVSAESAHAVSTAR